LTVVEHDPARDARAFEPVVAAVEEVAVGVEVIRPGACALAARGPARYFGGEEAAAERIVEHVAQVCAVESQVGIADGIFAAGLAARAGRLIAPGGTRDFLAGVPVETLERPELTDLLRRLGIKTLGDFAALPPSDVLSRFGFDGALAHRLAAGFDHRPLAVRRPPPDLDVADTFDEPLERVDVAAFAGRALAERLHERLAAHGLACTRLGIEAVTADGQELHRVWRHDGTLTAAAIAERVRWQLDGWLSGTHRNGPPRPTAGLVRLRLVPDGVLVHLGLQPGLWGDAGAERERAHRALSRVQGLLGPDAVVTAVLGGGRSADDQVRLVPWGDERVPGRPGAAPVDPIPPVAPASPQAGGWGPASLEAPGPVPGTSQAAGSDSSQALGPVPGTSQAAGSASSHASSPAALSVLAVPESESSGPRPAEVPPSTPAAAPTSVPALRAVPAPPVSVGTPAVPVPSEASGPASRGTASDESASAVPTVPVGLVSTVPASPENAPTASDTPVLPPVPPPTHTGGVVSDGPDRSGNPGPGPAAGSAVEVGGGLPGLRDGLPGLRDGLPGLRDGLPGSPGGRSRSRGTVSRRPAGTVARRPVQPAALPPWPGRLPRPAPALVLPQPLPAVVQDEAGVPVGVSARLELTGSPARLQVGDNDAVEIVGWAGPWPVDERWWAPEEARRRARFQVALADGRALLLFLAAGHWAVEAIYD
jgi:protein ImuB